MARLRSELELSLVDKVSRPARRVEQNLENLRNQQRRNEEMFNRHRNAMATTAVAAYALASAVRVPIQSAIDFESKLEDINQKVGTTKEGLTEIGAQARTLGLDTAVGAAQIAEAMDGLMAGGLDTQTALAVASPLGKVATAYGADVQEMVSLSTALLTNMDITAADMEGAFDVMSTGGKLGRFELSDMAGSFEEVTAAAQSLRISGRAGLADLTAALQVARMGAGSGSQAVTNLSNYMSKLMAPDAIKKFGEAGVDIVGSVNQAIAEGHSPIEHTIGILDRLTEGGKQDLLGKYFADAEVQKFIRPMIQNLELYRSIREEALGADGVIQRDFNSRMGTSGGVLVRFEASVQELNLAVGGALLPKLTEFVESVTPMIDGVSKFVTANEDLVAAVIEITAALIGLRLLASAGGMAGALMGIGGGATAGAGAGAIAGAGGLAAGATALSQKFLGTAFGKMAGGLAIFEAAKLANSMGVGEGFGGEKSVHHNIVHALDPTLAKILYEGFDPRAGMGMNGYDSGLVSPGQDPATVARSERIAALRADIERIENANLPTPSVDLHFMRIELEELEAAALAAGVASGQNLADGIGSQESSVSAHMAAILERLRIMAAAGVNIPVQINGPRALPGPSRMIDAPGNFNPPSMPTRTQGQSGQVGNTTTVGDVHVHVQNPTNADPRQMARLMGEEVGKSVRAAKSNYGSMG
ncbi:phage tail tape measure protein [Devosia naphthalenivorans]|uniref:phage tail tape measure protein n=1 Tax=Devosia naphthalenivorans TaxID=2082392 RepID=UPI0013B065F9|nr:phage tail tape measure protein [Devosia naphthalenivorans]